VNAKRLDLEQNLKRAEQKRQETLSGRSARAAKHFEAVVAKTGARQQQQASGAAALHLRLEETQAQKGALRDASLAERSARASQHNEAVAEKAQQHLETMKRQTQELRSKAAEERFALLAERVYEHYFVPCP